MPLRGGNITFNANGIVVHLPEDEWIKLPGMEEVWALDVSGKPGEKFFRALTGNRRVVDDKVSHKPDDVLRRLVKDFTEDDNTFPNDPGHLADSIALMLSNGRRFATTKKSFGFVPNETRVGDKIAIVPGCSVPIVIREVPGEEALWVVLGECYVDGLMEGEYMEIVRKNMVSPQGPTLM